MSTVQFPDITSSFKRSLHEVLAGYFDGATHEINDTIITFPTAKIVHDIRSLTKPLDLTIAIIGTGVQQQREVKCLNPNSLSQYKNHGIEIRADVIRNVIIVLPLTGGTNNKSRLDVDNAWGKLYAAFVGGLADLADKGIFNPVLDLIPSDITTSEQLIEAHGLLRCEIRASYARYNT